MNTCDQCGACRDTGCLCLPITMIEPSARPVQPAISIDALVAEFEATPKGLAAMQEGRQWVRETFAQPKREWVGLTDVEATALWESTDDRDSCELIKRVEAKLKEKNT